MPPANTGEASFEKMFPDKRQRTLEYYIIPTDGAGDPRIDEPQMLPKAPSGTRYSGNPFLRRPPR